jgi:hypothetical protein
MHNRKRLFFLIPAIIVVSLAFLALAAFFGLEYYATSVLKKEMDRQIREISDYIRIDYDSLGVNWLAFTVDLHKVRLSKPPLPGYVTIDRVAVRDFTSIGIKWIPTVVRLRNIVLSNDEVKLTAKDLVTSFSLQRIPTQAEIDRDWQVWWHELADGEIELTALTFSYQGAKLEIARMEADYAALLENQTNFGLKFQDLKFQDGEINLTTDTLSLAASLNRNQVPTRIANQVKDFSLRVPPALAQRDPFLRELAALGYDRLNFGINLDYDYHPDTLNLNLSWDAKAQNLGRLQFELHLADFNSPPLPANRSLANVIDFLSVLHSPIQSASLQGFKAVYQDAGLAPRLIAAEAQALGQTPEQFTQGLVASLDKTLGVLPLPKSLREQIKAVNRFILNPQEIQLIITCKRPVSLKKLQEGSFSGIFELLGNTEIEIISK